MRCQGSTKNRPCCPGSECMVKGAWLCAKARFAAETSWAVQPPERTLVHRLVARSTLGVDREPPQWWQGGRHLVTSRESSLFLKQGAANSCTGSKGKRVPMYMQAGGPGRNGAVVRQFPRAATFRQASMRARRPIRICLDHRSTHAHCEKLEGLIRRLNSRLAGRILTQAML